jgi:molybdopterin molybdotransferase
VELVVVSGGVSVGDYDLVPAALADLGGEVLFHRLRVRPGKPILAARLRDTWVVGLPGNPVSAFVGWHVLVSPLGEALAGNPVALDDQTVPAVLTAAASNRGDRTVIAPARLRSHSSGWRVTVLDWQGSHDVRALAEANALAVLEVGAAMGAGDRISCYRLAGGWS